MSTAEIQVSEEGLLWRLSKGEEPQSVHFESIRTRMWLLEHYCAGNIDTTVAYGKWAGDASHFLYVDYDVNNWAGWNPDTEYHPGSPIVKYRWGSSSGQVDIFVFKGTAKGNVLDVNPPVVGGKLNSLWLLTVDPNKYSHWNSNAGRPDIEAEGRWIISQHGWDDPALGGEGWLYGLWEAWKELPVHTDPYGQIPRLKRSGVIEARHHPVEKDKNDISIKLQTQSRRMYQDGFIGVDPITWWYDHDLPTTVSEYIRLNGDPADSIQWGPDYRELKKNSAFQDRIQHLIEQNYNYITKVDEDWIKAWQYWHVYGIEMSTSNIAGCSNPVYDRAVGGYRDPEDEWVLGGPPDFDKGEVCWHNNYFWLCIDNGGEWHEPGTEAGKEDWATEDDLTAKPLYQPNYMKPHPIYVQFSDPLFCCNSSAFEKVLKELGHYDWYWDENAAVPWWMYQKHYYLMTQERADPGVGHMQDALQRWPIPRGCWRRIWRHTQNWDKNRNQKSRFGKEISINGQMASMMWPGELGNPPGYDEQFVPSKALLDYRNTKPAWHWNDLTYQYVITEAQYNQMQNGPTYGWSYKQYYTVIDVEELFRQAYLNNSSIESRIAERHDPTTTDWIKVYNESTGLWEDEEVPIFEIHHDLVNDMRDVLLQLKYLKSTMDIEGTEVLGESTGQHYDTARECHAGAKAEALNEGNWQFDPPDHYVDWVCFVGYYTTMINWYSPPTIDYWEDTNDAFFWEYFQAKIVLTRPITRNVPGKNVGTASLRMGYWGQGKENLFGFDEWGTEDVCTIGWKDMTVTPSGLTGYNERESEYIGLSPEFMNWEPVFSGDYDGLGNPIWYLKAEFSIIPVSDWPPDTYFAGAPPNTFVDWQRMTGLVLDSLVDQGIVFSIDFDGYDASVFEEDPYNFIEV